MTESFITYGLLVPNKFWDEIQPTIQTTGKMAKSILRNRRVKVREGMDASSLKLVKSEEYHAIIIEDTVIDEKNGFIEFDKMDLLKYEYLVDFEIKFLTKIHEEILKEFPQYKNIIKLSWVVLV